MNKIPKCTLKQYYQLICTKTLPSIFHSRKRSNTTVENHATSADEPFSSLAYLGKRPRKFRINQKKKKRCKWNRYYNSRLLRKTRERKKKLRKQNQQTSLESRSQKRGGYKIRTKADKYFLYIKGIIDQIEQKVLKIEFKESYLTLTLGTFIFQFS